MNPHIQGFSRTSSDHAGMAQSEECDWGHVRIVAASEFVCVEVRGLEVSQNRGCASVSEGLARIRLHSVPPPDALCLRLGLHSYILPFVTLV